MNCKNCNQLLVKGSNYCPNCGQKNIAKLNLKFVLGEFFQTIFNLDSKVLRSLKYLVIKPGYLTKEYLEGRRVSYLAPIRMYLVLSFLFFFLISVFDFDTSNENAEDFSFTLNESEVSLNNNDSLQNKIDGTTFSIGGENVVVPASQLKEMYYKGTLDKGLDSLTADMPVFAGYISRKIAKASINDEGFLDVVRDQFSLFLVLFLPFFALLYATIFSGSKRGFVAHLVFNLHLNSFLIFALLMDLFIGSVLGSSDAASLLWKIFLVVFIQYYLIKGVMVFYQRNFWVAFYKYFLLLVGYFILALVFVVAVFFSSIVML